MNTQQAAEELRRGTCRALEGQVMAGEAECIAGRLRQKVCPGPGWVAVHLRDGPRLFRLERGKGGALRVELTPEAARLRPNEAGATSSTSGDCST